MMEYTSCCYFKEEEKKKKERYNPEYTLEKYTSTTPQKKRQRRKCLFHFGRFVTIVVVHE